MANDLNTTIKLKRLQQRGYESMLDYYAKVAPQFNEPLYLFLRSNAWGAFGRKEAAKLANVQWCERRTSSLTSGEAVYSIGSKCAANRFCV